MKKKDARRYQDSWFVLYQSLVTHPREKIPKNPMTQENESEKGEDLLEMFSEKGFKVGNFKVGKERRVGGHFLLDQFGWISPQKF